MPEKDVEITAGGIRRRTTRGKNRVAEQKRAKGRADRKKWDAEAVASKKLGRGEKYKECRQEIREAADKGEEYIRFTFSDWRGSGGGTIRGISEALVAKLKKAGFKATVIWPETERVGIMTTIIRGGVEVSWGPGEGHNKPRTDIYGRSW